MPNLLIVGPGGIGSAIAREQHARGWGITLLGRSGERIAAVAAGLPGCTTQVSDPTDIDGLPACAPALHELRPDGFQAVVCAVGSVLLQPSQRISAAAWRAVMAANLDAAFATLRLAIELMPNGGSVLLFSSGGFYAGPCRRIPRAGQRLLGKSSVFRVAKWRLGFLWKPSAD